MHVVPRAKFCNKSCLLFITAVAVLCAAATASYAADTEKVLASFSDSVGKFPQVGLVRDSEGNLYGEAWAGANPACKAAGGCGTIYRLSPEGGGWSKTILHRFNGRDGGNPFGTLILDSAGNLYGTTNTGGSSLCAIGSFVGCGTVFELSPGAGDAWTLKTLHRFNGVDGAGPSSSLLFDKNGNLYGTTFTKGANDAGTIFELHPLADGTWAGKTLHHFNGTDGSGAEGAMVFDASGNLYGATFQGGANNTGAVFKLSPNADGSWTESVLLSFGHSGGVRPAGGVIFDSAGNLFGTTSSDGSICDCKFGNVFKLKPNSDGSWTRETIHVFTTDGSTPEGITFDAAGNLIGFTLLGGPSNSGTVFQLSPGEGGSWSASQLHVFSGPDGAGPVGAPVLDTSGNIYGATVGGGASSKGAVFEVTPAN